MLSIRLPGPIEERLDRLAKSAGRTKAYYVREAILAHMGDMEAEEKRIKDSRLRKFRDAVPG